MNDDRRAAATIHRIVVVAQSHVRGHGGNVSFAIIVHGQDEIRNITCGHGVAVTGALEVGTRRLEIRGLALAALVDMHGMLPGGRFLMSNTIFTPSGAGENVAVPTFWPCALMMTATTGFVAVRELFS